MRPTEGPLLLHRRTCSIVCIRDSVADIWMAPADGVCGHVQHPRYTHLDVASPQIRRWNRCLLLRAPAEQIRSYSASTQFCMPIVLPPLPLQSAGCSHLVGLARVICRLDLHHHHPGGALRTPRPKPPNLPACQDHPYLQSGTVRGLRASYR